MNSVDKFSGGAMLLAGSVYGILSVRSAVRIWSHWKTYPHQAEKVCGLVGNVLTAVGAFSGAVISGYYLLGKVTIGGVLVSTLGWTAFSLFLAGWAVAKGTDKMPNFYDELGFWSEYPGVWFPPMNDSGYGGFRAPQPAADGGQE